MKTFLVRYRKTLGLIKFQWNYVLVESVDKESAMITAMCGANLPDSILSKLFTFTIEFDVLQTIKNSLDKEELKPERYYDLKSELESEKKISTDLAEGFSRLFREIVALKKENEQNRQLKNNYRKRLLKYMEAEKLAETETTTE